MDINEFDRKKKMTYLEGVLELMQAQLNFAQLSSHCLMSVEPDLTELFAEIKTVSLKDSFFFLFFPKAYRLYINGILAPSGP